MKSDRPPAMEQPPSVVEALPEDAAGIAHVRKETWLATYPNDAFGVTREDILAKDLESEQETALWRKAIENPKSSRKLWVAKTADGMIVGYGQGKKGEMENEIYGLYVLPGHQGKGIGRELMRRVVDWLGSEKPITLSVASYATNAIELYKRFGFEITDAPASGPTFVSGATIPSIKMIKQPTIMTTE